MGDFSALPDELWVLILDYCVEDMRMESLGTTLAVLGNLSMTNRRLRNLVMPTLEDCVSKLIGQGPVTSCSRQASNNMHLLFQVWLAVSECPMMVHRIQTLRPDITVLGFPDEEATHSKGGWFDVGTASSDDTAIDPQLKSRSFKHLHAFGQKVLRALGVNECIQEWDSFDGWLALLLLILPKLQCITWVSKGLVGASSPLRRIVDVAKKQEPQMSFRSLASVRLNGHFPSLVPDAIKWNFLVLPSVEAIEGSGSPGYHGKGDLADRLEISRDLRRISITTFQPGRPLPMHLLVEKFQRMPDLRHFRYCYSLNHNGGFLQMMALARTLQHLNRSLEELCIEPLTPASPIYRSRARTSPHMWKQQSKEQLIGNLGDATWLLGSLTAFERLRVLRAPRTALYDPRYVIALKRLLPRSIQHLDVSPGPPPHNLDAAMLTTQLVTVVRSKLERFPHLTKLTVGDHTVLLTPLLRDTCIKFDVKIEATTLRIANVSPCRKQKTQVATSLKQWTPIV